MTNAPAFPRSTAPLGHARYFLAGTLLFALKFSIDWSVSRFGFHRPWSPAEYLAPGSSLALLFAVPAERMFYLSLLVIALPFIAAGVWLTARRLREVGVSAGWTVLFFVPGVNFALFALLTTLPARREIPTASLATADLPPAPHAGAARPLAYAPGLNDREPWLARLLPRDPAAAKAVAIFAPVPVALLATFASVHWFRECGVLTRRFNCRVARGPLHSIQLVSPRGVS